MTRLEKLMEVFGIIIWDFFFELSASDISHQPLYLYFNGPFIHCRDFLEFLLNLPIPKNFGYMNVSLSQQFKVLKVFSYIY